MNQKEPNRPKWTELDQMDRTGPKWRIVPTPKTVQIKEDYYDEDDDVVEFATVGSCFSCCSSAVSREALYFIEVQLFP